MAMESVTEKTTIHKDPGYELGKEYYGAYKPPKGKIPEGFMWRVAERDSEKHFPIYWELKRISKEPPTMDELPPTDRSISNDEEQNFSNVNEKHDDKTPKTGLGGLTPPKDVGVPDWLENDLKD